MKIGLLHLSHLYGSFGALAIVLGLATVAQADTGWAGAKPDQPDKTAPLGLIPSEANLVQANPVQAVQPMLSDFVAPVAPAVAQSRLEQLRRLQARIERDRLTQDPQEQAQIAQLRQELTGQAESASAANYAAMVNPAEVVPPDAYPAQVNAPVSSPAADGVYLYGQQPVPDQLETAYFVFEVESGAVTGALYMPYSSYDCVQGQVSNDQMALNVTNSYSQETYSYALGLDTSAANVASQQGAVAAPVGISGFHPLPVSDRDRDLLATCQAKY
jgi:hypothetical protein